mmetsp:Transcript_39247/g.73202  ORF Transcript_39247/g.73202 Transcript_39247/m.73202 type:complete len:361 (+) Transcript_39247:186-1268(+)
MPLYEEKVICPLALHFTQEHIKTHFQDGRAVEDTVLEIQALPSGSEDFDLILKAPFPNIEILRWEPHSEDKEALRWYTLDNRRLYCLQKVAAQHWPQRVGVVVDILYADNGKVRRKYDSTTEGRSVTISPSVKVPALMRWDWRTRVDTKCLGSEAAMEAVRRDGAKPSVQDLCDVPPPAFETVLQDQTASLVDSLAALLGTTKTSPPNSQGISVPSSTGSTAASDGSVDSGQETPREEATAKTKMVWRVKGAESESTFSEESAGQRLEDQAVRLIQAQLAQSGRKGFVWIDKWSERFQKQLGTLRTFIESKPDLFTVKPGRGRAYRVEAVVQSQTCPTKWRKAQNFKGPGAGSRRCSKEV